MILGIDPGASGALAWLSAEGVLLDVQDMPVVLVGTRARVSGALLSDMVRSRMPQRAVVELVGGLPKQGGPASFQFGYASGAAEGVLAALAVPLEFVPPATWKRAMKVTKDKGSSRLMAQRLWPALAGRFARVKDDGRAEAALIGLHGLRRAA